MKTKLIILIIFLSIGVTSCRSTKEVNSKVVNHRIENSELIHTNTRVELAVKNITIIDRPCFNDSIREINQVLKSGKTTVTVKTEKGKLAIEIEKEKDSSTTVEKLVKVKDVKETLIDKRKVIIKNRVPRIFWIILALSFCLNVWAYRKPIFTFIRKLVFKV